MTKISVITINRNNRDGLRKTMQSVLEQDFDNFEYIVVDGASDDGSVEVIKEYEERFKQQGRIAFQYESKLDKGIFNAMNKGIVKSKGEYLLFLNSGDYLVAGNVLSSFARLGAKEDYVSGDIKIYINGREEIRKNPEKVDFLFFYSNALHHQATFIKRATFDVFGMYNEDNKIASDWEHSLRSIVVGGASYRHIELTVSYFNIYGVSSNEEFRSISAQEERHVFLSLMPEYVLNALEYYRNEEREWKEKQKIYEEYMTIRNGKWRFFIHSILRVKRIKRNYLHF